jgi:hypothetical protein
VWFGVAGLLFLAVLFQTMGRSDSTLADGAWPWFLPTVMPTLGLMAAVLTADIAETPSREAKEVSPFFFWLTMSVSGTYLLVVALFVLLPMQDDRKLELMKQSHVYLGPLQGVVSAFLGAFFFKGAQRKSGQEPKPEEAAAASSLKST